MSVVDSNISTSLVVADVSIRQDADGRYCLNDLHRAAGGDQKDKPVHFLKLDRTSDFIRELRVVGNPTSDKINDLEPVKVVKNFSGDQGTYVIKELVYAYAMWISPSFHLKVIRAYDTLVSGKASAPEKSLTPAQFLLEQARILVEIEARQTEQEDRIKRVEVKQQAIEEGFKYFTILAFSALNNIPVDLSMAKKLGKKAAALSREKGLSIDRVRDPRFGVIGAYHESILQTVFAEEIG